MSEVLLVAASTAFDDYRLYSAYFCRPNKTFRPVSHVAFYSGEVEPLIPKILDIIDELELSEEAIERCTLQTSLHRRVLLAIVEGMRAHSSSWRGRRVKAILLSSHSAQDTVKLPWPIRNDTLENHRACKWAGSVMHTHDGCITRHSRKTASH